MADLVTDIKNQIKSELELCRGKPGEFQAGFIEGLKWVLQNMVLCSECRKPLLTFDAIVWIDGGVTPIHTHCGRT